MGCCWLWKEANEYTFTAKNSHYYKTELFTYYYKKWNPLITLLLESINQWLEIPAQTFFHQP